MEVSTISNLLTIKYNLEDNCRPFYKKKKGPILKKNTGSSRSKACLSVAGTVIIWVLKFVALI